MVTVEKNFWEWPKKIGFASLFTLLFLVAGYMLAYPLPALLSLPSMPILQPVAAGVIAAGALLLNWIFLGIKKFRQKSDDSDPDKNKQTRVPVFPSLVATALALTVGVFGFSMLLGIPLLDASAIAGITLGVTTTISAAIWGGVTLLKKIGTAVARGLRAIGNTLPFNLYRAEGSVFHHIFSIFSSSVAALAFVGVGYGCTFLASLLFHFPMPTITLMMTGVTAAAVFVVNTVFTIVSHIVSPAKNTQPTNTFITDDKDSKKTTLSVSFYPPILTAMLTLAAGLFAASFFGGMPLSLCFEIAGIGAALAIVPPLLVRAGRAIKATCSRDDGREGGGYHNIYGDDTPPSCWSRFLPDCLSSRKKQPTQIADLSSDEDDNDLNNSNNDLT
jgi:hypothetical protein